MTTQLTPPLDASTDTMIWTIIEPGLGITAASIVTLRPLLRVFRIRGFIPEKGGPYPDQHSRGNNSRDSEFLGANARESNSHSWSPIHAHSGAVMTADVSASKNEASVSMQSYLGGDNRSQEVIIVLVE
jgi:hypothetical protein